MENPTFFVRVVNSAKLLSLFSLSFLLLEALFYGFFEGKSFFDSIWWALITATTVGYGDLYPATSGGRFVAITLVLGTIFFIIPMITASIVSKLMVNRDAFTHEEQEDMKEILKLILANQEKGKSLSE